MWEEHTSSLYFMIVLFSLDVSTQVTKSSICLQSESAGFPGTANTGLPCDEIRGVRDGVWTDADVSLFDELDGLCGNA